MYATIWDTLVSPDTKGTYLHNYEEEKVYVT